MTRERRQQPETLPNVVLQVSAVRRERRPSVSFRVSGSHHHEGKEGTHEGVVPVQEAHGRTRHNKSLNYSGFNAKEHRKRGNTVMVAVFNVTTVALPPHFCCFCYEFSQPQSIFCTHAVVSLTDFSVGVQQPLKV